MARYMQLIWNKKVSGVESMSDVKRTLKVIGIIGALECLFLQEVSEAKEGEAHAIFARPDSVLLAGPRQDVRAVQVDRRPTSNEPITHSTGPAERDVFPTRPIASEPTQAKPATTNVVRDSFPRFGEQGELTGKVIKESGNLMASRGGTTSGKTQALSETKVYIFKGKVEGISAGELKMPETTDPRVVDVVQTDAEGVYRSKLPPGTYTVFIEKEGRLYANVFDRTGNFSSIEVKTGDRSEENIKDTSEALY